MLILNVMWRELKIVIKTILHTLKKDQDHIPCSFADKVVCIDDKFSVLYRGKNSFYKFIEVILEEYNYCKNK